MVDIHYLPRIHYSKVMSAYIGSDSPGLDGDGIHIIDADGIRNVLAFLRDQLCEKGKLKLWRIGSGRVLLSADSKIVHQIHMKEEDWLNSFPIQVPEGFWDDLIDRAYLKMEKALWGFLPKFEIDFHKDKEQIAIAVRQMVTNRWYRFVDEKKRPLWSQFIDSDQGRNNYLVFCLQEDRHFDFLPTGELSDVVRSHHAIRVPVPDPPGWDWTLGRRGGGYIQDVCPSCSEYSLYGAICDPCLRQMKTIRTHTGQRRV